MNTVGKILVILNFLFAVIVGVLLVLNTAVRNNWKDEAESAIRANKVLKESLDTTSRVNQKVVADYLAAQRELDGEKQKLYDEKMARDLKEKDLDFTIQEKINELKIKDLTVLQVKQSSQRLADEIALLNVNIKERESAIVRLEASIKELRTSAVQFESLARTRQIQNENLLEQVRELTLALTREKSGVVSADVMVLRNPNEPNPPAVNVNGRLEKVEGDLVQISLGTDHGVAKNNTLDVYRLQPAPKYLGMVRIVDADHHRSVGRMIPTGNAAFRPALLVGDLVASKLTK